MQIKELHTLEEMMEHVHILQQLYPQLTSEKYRMMLQDMLPHNYGQVAVFDGENCIAISGFWIGTKLWSGKYIEMDNVVVHADHRSKGAGKLMSDYLDEKARALNCNMMALDAYTSNFKAHRFYYNQGYGVKGFHFIKVLNKEGLT